MNKDPPSLCLALWNDYAARDFVDSGVLEELSRHFRLSFVAGMKLSLDLGKYGVVHRYRDLPGWRIRMVLLARGLWHMHDKRQFEFNRSHGLARATFGVGPIISALVRLLSGLRLAGVVAATLRVCLRATARYSIPVGQAPDALLVFTSVNSYFADDLVREARAKRIPILALTNNWDNLNTKSFLESPPYLGVWGEQGFLIARLMHRLFPHQLFVVGAPRFEIYRRRLAKAEARRLLGVPDDARLLLFCGSGVSFEESSLIEELEAAISDGRLPGDLHVLYKPHPMRFQRTGEKPLDFTCLRHVTLAVSKRGLTELDLYPYLMAAADGVVSPFSTMVMEGAHHGLPALCLGYNDQGHANHDWDRVSYNLHLYVIRHSEWALVCDARAQFIEKCRALVRNLGDPRLAIEARKSASMVFHTGETTVAQNIARAIHRLLGGLDADDSYVAAQRSARSAPRRMTAEPIPADK
ncbi:MAG: hypothetical protein ACREQZ_11815 [Woeseiaceae bacterium]